MNPKKAFSKLMQLSKLEAEKHKLYEELRRSMIISMTFGEDIFADGPVKTQWFTQSIGGEETIVRGILIDGKGNEHELTPEFAEELNITIGELKDYQETTGETYGNLS